jgi:hypothetical protein
MRQVVLNKKSLSLTDLTENQPVPIWPPTAP